MTLAFEDANSNVEVDTVAEADDEDPIGNSLLQNCKLRFGYKVKLLFSILPYLIFVTDTTDMSV